MKHRTVLLIHVALCVFIATLIVVASGCSTSESNLSRPAKTSVKSTSSIGGAGKDTTSSTVSTTTPLKALSRASERGEVIRVIDGDTIEVRLTDGQVRRVRYIGIDTPERSEDLYTEAKRANAKLVEGKEVRLIKDVSETDRYGRLLRYVYTGDTFVNAELVRQGYAAAATYPPDVAYAEYFVKLAAEAREKGVGLWSDDTRRAPPETTLKKPQSQSLGAYIGNRNSRVFHLPSCRSLPAPHNQVPLANRNEAVRAGYSPCGICKP